MCQIEKIDEMGYEDSNLYVKCNFIAFFKKIGIFTIANKIFKYKSKTFSEKVISEGSCCRKSNNPLKPEGVLIVRSKEEILETLDENNRLEGCGFMDEMWQYCNTRQKVFKRVEYFFDERNSRFFKARNTVLLEGLRCSGKLSKLMPRCDRSCYFFWREEWLKKID